MGNALLGNFNDYAELGGKPDHAVGRDGLGLVRAG